MEGYTYNLTGDRLSKTQGGTTTPYGYGSPLTRHRLLTVGSDTRDYDNDGNLMDGSVPNQTFIFDDRHRLVTFNRTGVGTGGGGTYDYNGRGERVFKDGVGPLTQHNPAHFVYDEAGQLLTNNGNGNPHSTDYIYADGPPVALVRSGTIYYVHTDQLGAPRAVTAAGSATPVWSWAWQGNPFGDQAPTPASFVMPLRFPGQYADPESGLNYNYFRTYEPATGRYIESDPIGLKGGVSTYSYVRSRVLNWFDQYGLDVGGTIVCDGNGGFEIINNDKTCTGPCTRAHEEQHVRDFQAWAPNICRGQPRGTPPGPDLERMADPSQTLHPLPRFPLQRSECRAYRVGKACAESLKCCDHAKEFIAVAERALRTYQCSAYGW